MRSDVTIPTLVDDLSVSRFPHEFLCFKDRIRIGGCNIVIRRCEPVRHRHADVQQNLPRVSQHGDINKGRHCRVGRLSARLYIDLHILRTCLRSRSRIFGNADRGSIGSIFAIVLALITYFLGNFWDDRVFDPRYTEDPQRNVRGKWLDTSRRNCVGLLPAGRDLDQARKRTAEDLKLPSVEGVYAAAKQQLRGTKRATAAERLLFLSKLCRGLIWPSFLAAAGLTTQAAYVALTE